MPNWQVLGCVYIRMDFAYVGGADTENMAKAIAVDHAKRGRAKGVQRVLGTEIFSVEKISASRFKRTVEEPV